LIIRACAAVTTAVEVCFSSVLVPVAATGLANGAGADIAQAVCAADARVATAARLAGPSTINVALILILDAIQAVVAAGATGRNTASLIAVARLANAADAAVA
jgi:hypothetical protein